MGVNDEKKIMYNQNKLVREIIIIGIEKKLEVLRSQGEKIIKVGKL